ncbi:uncharacterized protein LOC108632936 [Ceratina calcarata]|uniref:Uncharacterized protein LOC108632936 n=1 Tax=Ceratina calcarata TaxID=156304 RepID=A0AAJ7JHG8_9HYME|nr:uncharacterized protein LOC108632936 [Ceratina calcarata]
MQSIMLFATGLNGTGSKQTVPVKATYIYPTYEAYSVLPDRDHNVALLKLTKPFDMCPNKVTLPDVLPVNYNDDDYRLCLIFGWQSYVSLSSKVLAKPIHYDVVILNSWRMCTYMIKTTTNYTNLFCAMVEFKDEMKACAGNPGSPVVCENQNRETALVGIASWTNFSFECGDLPTYIDLGSFRIWMSELVFNIKNAEEWERNKELDGKRCPNDTNIRQNRSDLLRLDSRVNFKRKNTRVQFPNSSRTLVKHPESENINDSYLLNKFHRSANSFNNISTPPDGYYEMYVDVSKEASSNIFKYREIGSSQNNNQVVENVKNEQFTVMNRSSLCDQQFDKVTVKQSTEQTEIDDFELLLPFTFEDVGVSRSNIITVYFKGLYLFIYFVSCYFYIIYMQ